MTTSEPTPTRTPLGRVVQRTNGSSSSTAQVPAQMTAQAADTTATTAAGGRTISRVATQALAVLRIGLGFVFLWAFLDKTFGWGYATPAARAWVNGGSPTKGFLSSVSAGPFANLAHDIAGQGWADWLFMAGLLGIGVALIAGVAMRIAAASGVLLTLMMWAAVWPMAKVLSTGEPSGSNNPFFDDHVLEALVLVVLALTYAGHTWGFGRMWARVPFVQRHRWLI